MAVEYPVTVDLDHVPTHVQVYDEPQFDIRGGDSLAPGDSSAKDLLMIVIDKRRTI